MTLPRAALIISAFVSASLCALTLAVIVGAAGAADLGTFIVIPFAVVGAGIYVRLRRFGIVRLRTALAAGFALAALPLLLIGLFPAADSASIGGMPTVSHGYNTAFGWLQILLLAGGMALRGWAPD